MVHMYSISYMQFCTDIVPSLVSIMYKQWTLHAPVLDYPEFRQLGHIKFMLPCFDSNLLVTVLDKCHMLRVLILQSNKVC